MQRILLLAAIVALDDRRCALADFITGTPFVYAVDLSEPLADHNHPQHQPQHQPQSTATTPGLCNPAKLVSLSTGNSPFVIAAGVPSRFVIDVGTRSEELESSIVSGDVGNGVGTFFVDAVGGVDGFAFSSTLESPGYIKIEYAGIFMGEEGVEGELEGRAKFEEDGCYTDVAVGYVTAAPPPSLIDFELTLDDVFKTFSPEDQIDYLSDFSVLLNSILPFDFQMGNFAVLSVATGSGSISMKVGVHGLATCDEFVATKMALLALRSPDNKLKLAEDLDDVRTDIGAIISLNGECQHHAVTSTQHQPQCTHTVGMRMDGIEEISTIQITNPHSSDCCSMCNRLLRCRFYSSADGQCSLFAKAGELVSDSSAVCGFIREEPTTTTAITTTETQEASTAPSTIPQYIGSGSGSGRASGSGSGTGLTTISSTPTSTSSTHTTGTRNGQAPSTKDTSWAVPVAIAALSLVGVAIIGVAVVICVRRKGTVAEMPESMEMQLRTTSAMGLPEDEYLSFAAGLKVAAAEASDRMATSNPNYSEMPGDDRMATSNPNYIEMPAGDRMATSNPNYIEISETEFEFEC